MTKAPDELPSPLVTQRLTDVLREVSELTRTEVPSPPESRNLSRNVSRALDHLENLDQIRAQGQAEEVDASSDVEMGEVDASSDVEMGEVDASSDAETGEVDASASGDGPPDAPEPQALQKRGQRQRDRDPVGQAAEVDQTL